jgi:DNA-directed RNA polymerase specialized sigma24 family protein
MGPFVFPPTRHSVLDRIREADPDVRREAFGDVVTGYWKPVYTYLRLRWHLSPEDAQDLTQAFFSEAYQRAWLERYEPAKARFRTFVRVCADRCVMNWRQAATRMKRGGQAETVSLDFTAGERDLGAAGVATPPEADELFHREFVRALFERAVGAVRAECEREGHGLQFQLFERYDLSGDEGVSYAQLADAYGLTTAQVTNHLAHVRRRFRAHALQALEALSGTREEFRRDAREILGVDIA